MFYHVETVRPLDNLWLGVRFRNGVEKHYDVKPLLKQRKLFEALTYTDGLFEQVKVDQGGYGISWNDEIDLSCNELWEGGIPVAKTE